MPRLPSVPSYRLHRPSGRAVVTVRTASGRRDIYLGEYNSPESRREYARVVAELAVTDVHPKAVSLASPQCLTVNELLLAFMRHAVTYYRTPDGKPTSEVREIKLSIALVRELYGLSLASEFGPVALEAVRRRMIDAGLCRKLINRRIDRVKRVFKWAASKELVPAAAYQALRTLAGLRAGRTEARESKPVRPVDPAHVAATLPFLNRHLRAMVELQRLTGMRPGEACGLTFGEVDRSGELWLYRPTQHKTRHHGKDRVIPLGPRARAVLIAFLVGDHPPPRGFEQIDLRDNTARLVAADAYQEAGRERDALLLRDLARPVVSVAGCVVDPAAPVFSPREAREERFRAMRAGRKTKVQPSQRNRRADNPKRSPKDRFSDVGYAHAVGDAAARAGVPHWHPNQLRHLVGTEVREGHGLEAAQVLLGHSHAKATEVYAERNLKLAAAVAAKIG